MRSMTRICRRRCISSREGFVGNRAKAVARLPEFEALRDAARDIKAHTLAHLDLYLEAYEAKVAASGGTVHWAATPRRQRDRPRHLPARHGAKSVTKGKSMIGEEIGVNDRARSGRHHAGRNRSRRIYHPTAP